MRFLKVLAWLQAMMAAACGSAIGSSQGSERFWAGRIEAGYEQLILFSEVKALVEGIFQEVTPERSSEILKLKENKQEAVLV